MANSATLAIKIVSDASGASKGFDDAEKKVGGFTSGLDKASIAATGVLAGVGALATAAFNSASELQQAGGAVESVFGAQAKAVQAAADGAAQSVGLASADYSNLAALLGSQLKGMGFAADTLGPKSNDLIKLGADLAATYGGTTKEAVEALSGVLKGETDPIERYGVSIKQSDISARLAADGHDKLTGAALKTATAQAAMALITDQTTSAVGQFGRESDTASGQQQRMAAEVENAKAKLGTSLLPIVAAVSEKLAGLAGFASDNSSAFTIVAGVFAAVAVAILAINAGVKAYEAGVKLATAVQWLWNVAMDANPIGLVIAGVAGLIALGVVLYNKFKPFHDLVEAIVGWFKKAWDWASKLVSGAVGKVVGWFSAPEGGGGSAPVGPGGGTSAAAPFRGAGAGPIRAAAFGGGVGSSSGTSSASASSGPAPAGNTYITVQGAVDPLGTARTIRDLLDERDRTLGTTGPLSVGLARG